MGRQMRVFPHPNMSNFKCPVCKTSADEPVTLIPIAGTEKDGIVQADQWHKECYDLVMKMTDKEKAKKNE